MEDEPSSPLDGKGLGNLRVVDLKQELEKRGLSKSGSKKELVKRLKQQIDFEKLCEERKSAGEFDHKLELDAATEQNEFVQQYLAQQQKRMDEKRLALEANQVPGEEKVKESNEELESTDENSGSESDETDDDRRKRDQCNEEKKNEKNSGVKLLIKVSNRPVEKCSSASVTEDEERTKSASLFDALGNTSQPQKDTSNPDDASEKVSEKHKDASNSIDVSENIIEQYKHPRSPVDKSESVNNQKEDHSPVNVSGNENELSKTANDLIDLSENVCEQQKVPRSPVDVYVNEEKRGPRTPVDLSQCINENLRGPRTPEDVSENINEDQDSLKTSDDLLENVNKDLVGQRNSNSNIDNGTTESENPLVCVDDHKKGDIDQDKDTIHHTDNICSSESERHTVLESDTIKTTITSPDIQIPVHTMCTENSQLSERVAKSPSASDAPVVEKSSSEHSCRQDSVSNMESSQCSSVPYTLSDIQLPGSPGNRHPEATKSEKIEETPCKTDSSDNEATKDTSTEDKIKANGVVVIDEKSLREEISSDLESNKNLESSEKIQKAEKISRESRWSDKGGKGDSAVTEKFQESKKKSSRNRHSDKSGSPEAKQNSPERIQKVGKKSRVKHSERSVSPEKIHKEKKSKSKRTDRSDSSEKVQKRERKSRSRHFEQSISPEVKHNSPERTENLEKKSKSRHYDKSVTPERKLNSPEPNESLEKKSKTWKSDIRVSPDNRDSPENVKNMEIKSENRHSDRSVSPEQVENLEKKSKSKWSDKSMSQEKKLDQPEKLKKHEKKSKKKRYDESVSPERKKDSSERIENLHDESKKRQSDRSTSPEIQDLMKNTENLKNVARNRWSDRSISPEIKEGSPERRQKSEKRHTKSKWSAKTESAKEKQEKSEKKKSRRFERSASPEIKYGLSEKIQSPEEKSTKNMSVRSVSPEIKPDAPEKTENLEKKSAEIIQYDSDSHEVKQNSPEKDSENKCFDKSISPEKFKNVDKKSTKSRWSKSSNSPEVIAKESDFRRSSCSERSVSPEKRGVSPQKVPELEKKTSESRQSDSQDTSDEESDKSDRRHRSVKSQSKVQDRSSNVVNSKEHSKGVDDERKSLEVLSVENSSNSLIVSDKLSESESTEPKAPESHEIPYVPRKVSLSNRKLNRSSSEDVSIEPKQKKCKWGSFATVRKSSQTIHMSTDSLKNWFPDFKLISEPNTPMELESEDQSLPAVEEKQPSYSQAQPDAFDVTESGHQRASTSHADVEDVEPIIEEMAEKGPVSKIIFIQNLVRPFTLNQLKDLLKQSGNIVEEFFWIDKIKSKCFVKYETEKEAAKARNALNNTRWPPSNPKILSVEFSSEEELEYHKKGNEPPPKPAPEPVVETPEVIDAREHVIEERRKEREQRRRDREKTKPQLPVREWDKDKIVQESPERAPVPREEKPRSVERKEKKESKKRPNEDTSAKLLDDLFQKTKSTPCIYWLPLTEEQAIQKEEARKLRKLELDKRNQQQRELGDNDRRGRRARSPRRSRERDTRKSSTRSRSPVPRRR